MRCTDGAGQNGPRIEAHDRLTVGARDYVTRWWAATIPGFLRTRTVVTVGQFGHGLPDYLDPCAASRYAARVERRLAR